MMATANGIAHLSFLGGALFLPVRTPYDRQLLAEYAAERAHAKGRVQILVNGQRWLVQLKRDAVSVGCHGCGDRVDSTRYSVADDGEIYCAKCALDGSVTTVPRLLQARREAV